jgi:hypothetical protein
MQIATYVPADLLSKQNFQDRDRRDASNPFPAGSDRSLVDGAPDIMVRGTFWPISLQPQQYTCTPVALSEGIVLFVHAGT